MLYIQAETAMYFVLRQGRYHNISIQCQLKLFDSMVLPVLLYGSEIWAFENVSLMEKMCNKFLKLLLPVRKTTPLYLLYGELGRFPVHISVKLRMIAFWFRLLTGKQSKLSLLVYNLLLNDMNNHVYDHKWLLFVTSILDYAGYTHIWISQCDGITSTDVLKIYINAMLTGQYLQSWYAYIDNSSKASNYKLFKHTFAFETYITIVEKKYWCPLIRFRLSNHNLPIETGRWENVQYKTEYVHYAITLISGMSFIIYLHVPFSKMKQIVSYQSKPNIYKLLKLFK